MQCGVLATKPLLHLLAAVGSSVVAAVLAAGKELIENLTVLRFSNRVFEPLWSRQYIRNVQVNRVMSCCRKMFLPMLCLLGEGLGTAVHECTQRTLLLFAVLP
jgi:hypothetical protein